MRKFFTIVGMLIIIGVFAAVIYTGYQHNLQNEKAQALYDSAERLIADAPEEMSYSQALKQYEKLYELIDKIATEYPQSNIAKDIRLKKAYPLLFLSNIKNSLKYLRYFEQASTNLGHCLIFLNKMSGPGNYLNPLMVLAQTYIDNSKTDAALPILEGMYLLRKERYESSQFSAGLESLARQFIELNHFETAFKIAELNNNTFLKAFINNALLKKQLEKKQIADAKQTITKINNLQKALKKPQRRVEILLKAVDIYNKADKNELRDTYIKLAEEIAKTIKDSVDQNQALCNIAAHHAIFENHDQAEKIIEQLKPQKWDDTCLITIIEKYIENNNFKLALKYAEKLNSTQFYIKIAQAQAQAKQSKNALQTLAIALETNANESETTRISNQTKIAEVYNTLGKRQRAQNLISAAIKETKNIRFIYKNRLFSAITQTCMNSGLFAQLDEAIKQMEDKITSKAFAVSVLAAQQNKQGITSAKQEAIKALKLAKQIESFTKECKELQKISNYWANKGLFSWAYQGSQMIRDPKLKIISLKYLAEKCSEANKFKMAESILQELPDKRKSRNKEDFIIQKSVREYVKKENFLQASKEAAKINNSSLQKESLFLILYKICEKKLHTSPDSSKYLEAIVQAAVPTSMFFNPELRRRNKLSRKLSPWFQ